jgi:hypothetical protein
MSARSASRLPDATLPERRFVSSAKARRKIIEADTGRPETMAAVVMSHESWESERGSKATPRGLAVVLFGMVVVFLAWIVAGLQKKKAPALDASGALGEQGHAVRSTRAWSRPG